MLGKIESRRWRDDEAEKVCWHHWLSGHEFEQVPGDDEGQGKLVGCSPCGHESDMTEWLNNNNQFVWNGVINIHESTDQGKTLTALWGYLLNHFITWWTARRSNQSILKEISPGYSLEGMMLKLKLQYFGHLMQRKSWLIGKDSDAGRNWGQEEKGMTKDEMIGWHHQLNGYEFW